MCIQSIEKSTGVKREAVVAAAKPPNDAGTGQATAAPVGAAVSLDSLDVQMVDAGGAGNGKDSAKGGVSDGVALATEGATAEG
eukprot:3430911-Alexandrium_andersonii.AAC.1